MMKQKTSFWDAVEVAQKSILAGNKTAAINSIQEARLAATEAVEELSARRHSLLDSLLRMADPNHVPAHPVDSLPNADHDTAPAPSPNIAHPQADQPPAQRVLVSGIGRSGTTLIYQQLAKLLLLDSRKVNFRYEPYLWNIRTPYSKGNPFDMSQLHHFGLQTHCSAPLFLDGEHPVHDSFIDHLFNSKWDGDSKQYPDSYLAKIIRGSGRLRSYLKRFPDLKIVACLRNPIDTINSSLGMFSFFGEEFHPDDRPRFRSEIEARGMDVSQLNIPDLRIEWYAKWWRAFTEETLAVANEYPDNVMLFCYEAFQKSPADSLEALMSFIGTHNLGMFIGLNKPAGLTIKSISLTQHDLSVLKTDIDYYTDTVLKPRLGEKDAGARTDNIISRCITGRFSFPTAGCDLGRRNTIQLRDTILGGGKSPFTKLVQRQMHPVSLDDLIALHHASNPAELRIPAKNVDSIKKGKRFGVVITCHNNEATIVDAVLSCLNQTLPYDEIVVVNDKSSDGSATLLEELAQRYSCLQILDLPSNLGPSAGRDLGIRKLTTDFFTQLDGDDLFWPTKNAQEATAVAGDENVVAFSDILLVRPEKSFIRSTAAYDGKSGTEAWLALLARTPQIPRDMTISRQNYFDAGGYDMNRHLYEDWEFKLRLTMKTKSWIRADGLAGTIYNRLSPGLSGVNDGKHARALSQIFLSALQNSGDMPLDSLLPAFDSAIGTFKNRHVSMRTHAVLESCLTRKISLEALAELAGRRDLLSADNARYAAALDAFDVKSTDNPVHA